MNLTPRELEVLDLYYKGKSLSEIQQILGLCHSTVDRHLQLMQARLGAEHRHGAIYAALKEGILKVPEKK